LKGEKGFALVITLIVAALLVALTVEFVNEVYVDTSARQNFVDGQQASLLAGSGIAGGRAILEYALARPEQNYTSLADLDRFAKLLQISDDNGALQVTLEEESGKLNINAIVNDRGEDKSPYRGIADRLFKKLGLPPELLDCVADWIGKDEIPRTGGAKTTYYKTLKPPYAVKNGPLETFEELRLVKGFDAKILERLRPFVTVYRDEARSPTATPTSAAINVNTAAKELLASLDEAMTEDLAERIIDYRKITPLKSPTDLGDNVSGMQLMSQVLATNGVIMQQEKGSVFRLVSRAQVKESVRIIEAVVRVGESQPLYWREY